MLVQDLLVAKRDLRLSKEIKKLAKHDGLIIDEMGYVQQSREEMEVLFTLLAERYERGSVLLTSNLPVLEVGGNLQRPDDHGGSHRPAGAPLRHPGAEYPELPHGAGQEESGPKSRFSSLPTALGNPAKPAGFPLFPQPRLLLVSLKQHREI